MTASIQIKNDKYYIVLNWKEYSKRKQKWIKTDLSVSGNNKRKAEQLKIETLKEWETKINLNDNNILFSDYMKLWLEETRCSISKNTYFSYKQTIYNTICPYFEERKILLCDLKPYHIQGFYNHKSFDDKVTANTIYHYHANIHKALNYAVKSERILSNPADKIELPKKEKHIAQYYTADELNTLLKKIQGKDLEIVVLLAAFFGLRRGEIIGLRWSSINFKINTLSITGTVKDKGTSGSKIKNMYYESSAKTNSSIRSFPMPEKLVLYLKDLKQKQDKQSKLKYYNHNWDDFVCVRRNGDLIPLEYVSRAFPKLCEECGLRRITLHELRHTNISLLLEDGASMKELQEWAGHSNYGTTANIYSHIQAKSKIKLTKSLENIIG